jgi:triosephosphate isomerase
MKKLIVANWKMYLTLSQSIALAKKFTVVSSQFTAVELVLCPSFIALEEVAKALRGSQVKLGAQSVEAVRSGAFTGEVGLDDLRALNVEYVLVGHSERRRYFGETNAVVNQKLKAVLKAGMRPILCVGEPSRTPTPPNPPSGRGGKLVWNMKCLLWIMIQKTGPWGWWKKNFRPCM